MLPCIHLQTIRSRLRPSNWPFGRIYLLLFSVEGTQREKRESLLLLLIFMSSGQSVSSYLAAMSSHTAHCLSQPASQIPIDLLIDQCSLFVLLFVDSAPSASLVGSLVPSYAHTSIRATPSLEMDLAVCLPLEQTTTRTHKFSIII